MKSIAVQIEGIVQGVWFRQSTCNKALELGVSGVVCNKPDGTVYVEITGEDVAVRSLVEFCRQGPPGAEVKKVVITDIIPRHEGEFYILR